MKTFPCPYLSGEVELTDEREEHIQVTHPDLLPEYLAEIGQTLIDPDEIHHSKHMSAAKIFYRWFETVRKGKHVAVVIVSEAAPTNRNWIITAYITRQLPKGEIEWHKT